MTLWIVLTALVAFACGLLAVPFLRRLAPATGDDGAARFAAAQIAELDADVARGAMTAPEAEAARAEIERRLLKATKDGAPELVDESPRLRLIGVGILAGWVVVGSVALYGVVGRPELGAVRAPARMSAALPPQTGTAAPAQTAAATQAQTQQDLPSVDTAIAALATRLKDNPDDAEGWRMLGWSYFQTAKYTESVDAYQKAVALDPSKPVIFSVLGEAMVRANGGAVSEDALAIFDKALALDPTDARAQFFKGLALEQKGDEEGALKTWQEVLGRAPSNADWAPGLRLRVTALAQRLGKDVPGLTPPVSGAAPAAPAQTAPAPSEPAISQAAPATPGPTAADVAAAAQMSEQDRATMIRGMVERLASRLDANPDDTEGWVRLILSYMVLGEPQAARDALGNAKTRVAPEAYAQIASQARNLGVE